MLDQLRGKKLITSTEVNDLECAYEKKYRAEFVKFLAEIPGDFKTIATQKNKKELVKNHLASLYHNSPTSDDVDAVLERVINLAFLIEHGRDKVEDKASQSTFKSANWKTSSRCDICGYRFTSQNDATIDHVVPLALGGPDNESNWQLVCSLCNSQKSDNWGISDISRRQYIRILQGNFFNLDPKTLIGQLRSKSNPTRYWIFERDGRKCISCPGSAKNEKLHIGVVNSDQLLNIENLHAYCADCLKKIKIKFHCE